MQIKLNRSKQNADSSSNLLVNTEIILEEDSDFEDNELEVKTEKSVINYLLSQVRIGMDLSKITLPTYILETRSMLEMFADFIACTDLILHILDLASPHERMIQVL